MSSSEHDVTSGATGGVGPQERAARATWSRLAEPGDPRATELVATYGAVLALSLVLDGDPRTPEIFRIRASRREGPPEIEAAAALGARVLCPGDDEWPVGVDDHPEPPLCLWVRGPADLSMLARRSVAVVGARNCTSYGDHVASDLAAGLAERGWTVVSGAAFGIDVAAHRGALAVGGATVAVLAGGVDRHYPVAHDELLRRLVEVGAVVSEPAPGSAPTAGRFLLRNRLIATMTRGTVVVEAGLRSGSLNTARSAASCGRPVGVVPGPITSVASAGCHQAVREGVAQIVTDVEEVLDLIGSMGVDAAPRRSAPVAAVDLLDPEDAAVLSAVPVRRGGSVDRVAVAAGVSSTAAQAALGRLLLGGLVVRDTVGWRKPGAGRR
ncbi:DNA-processing protein DprA [Lapillicoccus sp.]|uniref:DNA-processing protein DprA n=1 Tax=Lapillicoccus sp. TaxID=1909287 RepID=UPI0032672D98